MDCVKIEDPIGIAGGLAVLWKRDLNVRFICSNSFFIEIKIKDDDNDHVWRLINLYASSTDSVRKLQWEELIRYRQQSSKDWIILGDFNDVLWADEKQGGRNRAAWSLKAFRDFVTNLEAVDLGYSGYPFTWTNRRGGNGMVKERLDRVLASPSWSLQYDRAKVQNLFPVGSDHATLLVDTRPPKFTGHRQFRFDNRWVEDPSCHEVICRGWQGSSRGSNMFKVFDKVRNTRRELEMRKIRILEKELGEAWVQEEKYWRQKARIPWMVEGDRNISFFHAKVTQRRKRNIAGIQDSFGNWREGQEDIAKEFVQ
ncbi:hypothetical protein Vadar_020566 [Vaccinium darrowii]|uniref:Uncharacterized protein n=1 Tax=Vaccinium darrowii TaxID=229202 RepID=A0ACB7XIW2_9ERIC|nr:hypothetical protein Vadar_020566 [Vaccinium darrowii]